MSSIQFKYREKKKTLNWTLIEKSRKSSENCAFSRFVFTESKKKNRCKLLKTISLLLSSFEFAISRMNMSKVRRSKLLLSRAFNATRFSDEIKAKNLISFDGGHEIRRINFNFIHVEEARARGREGERKRKKSFLWCNAFRFSMSFFGGLRKTFGCHAAMFQKMFRNIFSLSFPSLSSCLPEDEIVFREFYRNSFQARHDKSFFEMAVARRLSSTHRRLMECRALVVLWIHVSSFD